MDPSGRGKMKKKQVYKITFPNGKIYVGKDLTGTLTYFGSFDEDYVSKDFPEQQRKLFTITKEILWETTEQSDVEINKREVEFIRSLCSNDPEVGYNQWPKFKRPADRPQESGEQKEDS
jgi:hypothetical protein